MPPTSPIRLALSLNWSVFNYEILGKSEDAISIAKSAFDAAIYNIDNVGPDDYKECTLVMQMLRDNLTLWSSDQQNEENEDN